MSTLRNISQSIFGKQTFLLTEISKDGKIVKKGSVLEADAIISENYSKQANVTTYPVEKGNDIAEHATTNSFTISVQGITSDASMSYFDLKEAFAGSAIAGVLRKQDKFDSSSKSQKVWKLLNKWMEEGIGLQLKCKYEEQGFVDTAGAIIPWVIESLSVSRSASVGAAIQYNLTLRQIQLVTIGQGTQVDIRLGVFDKGAQQLLSGNGPEAVEAQSNGQRTRTALVDDLPLTKKLGLEVI